MSRSFLSLSRWVFHMYHCHCLCALYRWSSSLLYQIIVLIKQAAVFWVGNQLGPLPLKCLHIILPRGSVFWTGYYETNIRSCV
jgi:hypothetical protein